MDIFLFHLVGTWVEEKTFGEPLIWISFDGPEEKPFRLRFELKAEGENFRLTGIKARPLGKGNQIKFNQDSKVLPFLRKVLKLIIQIEKIHYAI